MFSAPAVKLCTEETTSAIKKSKTTFRHNHTISAVNCCITSSDIFSFPSNSSSVSLRGTVKVRISSAISKHASTRYDRHPKTLSSLLEKSMLQFSRAARTLLSACQHGNLQKRARNGRSQIFSRTLRTIAATFVTYLTPSLAHQPDEKGSRTTKRGKSPYWDTIRTTSTTFSCISSSPPTHKGHSRAIAA
jgi:hypothetical protein